MSHGSYRRSQISRAEAVARFEIVRAMRAKTDISEATEDNIGLGWIGASNDKRCIEVKQCKFRQKSW
jgi:hypothetical protein